jgi:polyisoprenoid-binding protein YceI
MGKSSMIFQCSYRRGAIAAAFGAASLGAITLAATPIWAQPAPGAAPPARTPPSHDYKAAVAGKYAVDPNHTAVVVRVPHMGFSYSEFRMYKVAGILDWNPDSPAADSLSATVDPTAIGTPVEGFPAEISSRFLKSGQFPQVTFKSRAFHPIDANHGKVEGDLTLLGVTKPVTFDVTLVGTGKGMRGAVIGISARTMFDPKDFGLPALAPEPYTLTIDAEFDKQTG